MSEIIDESSNASGFDSIETTDDVKNEQIRRKDGSNRSKRYEAPVASESEQRSSRRRIKTTRFDTDFLDNEEQRLLQHALKVSKKDSKRVAVELPLAPVYYPTLEEFHDTLGYIQKIRPEAEAFGICKIVPPAEWQPVCQIDMSCPKKFATKLQQINTLQEGQGFDDGKQYTIEGYKKMADAFYADWCKKHYGEGVTPTQEQLAKDYWEMVETNNRQAAVEYGNDLDTTKYMSGFVPSRSAQYGSSHKGATIKSERIDSRTNTFSKDYYSTTGWNLNNIPSTQGSVLKYLQTPVNGVNVPWLYLGMLFSSFCWHNEDNYFYSINYNHFGGVKQWYGIAGSEASKFEKVSKDFLLGLFRESPDLLHHMTTQISPSLLMNNGISVCKMDQEPRTFIITFPKAYHCGFSYGFNCGEAVNFATSDWLKLGGEAEERYRSFARESVFSHQRLLFTILKHKDEISRKSRKDLAEEVTRIIDEELVSRPFIFNQGVRDLSAVVNLPGNDFRVIDNEAVEYDEMRSCCMCKNICVFSAVACECNKTNVSCTRHFNLMCKCPKEKKFFLAWESTESLVGMRKEVSEMIK